MAMVRIYLYGIDQSVIIPRVVQSEEGAYVELGPVSVFHVSALKDWKEHVMGILLDGHERLEMDSLDCEEGPGSAILDLLNLDRWSDFERYAVMYILHTGPKYTVVYCTGRNDDGMWKIGDNERYFHNRAPLDMVLDELASDLMVEPEAAPRTPKLLMGP